MKSVLLSHFAGNIFPTHFYFIFLPPAKEVGEAYVFTGVCLSTGMGVSAPLHAWIHPPGPEADTPPWKERQTPPGTRGRPPGTRGRHSPPPADTSPRWTPPLRSACWDTVNNRAVRIQLECILFILI